MRWWREFRRRRWGVNLILRDGDCIGRMRVPRSEVWLYVRPGSGWEIER